MLTNYNFNDNDIASVYRSSCKRPDAPKGGTAFKELKPTTTEDIRLRLHVLEYYRECFVNSEKPEHIAIAILIGKTMLKLKSKAGLFIPNADAGKLVVKMHPIPQSVRNISRAFDALLKGRKSSTFIDIFGTL